MIVIGNTIVSDEVAEEKFLCDLAACRGACCVAGDAGAPLEPGEAAVIEEVYEAVKPYMQPEGIRAVDSQGFSVKDDEGETVTPLVNDRQCAYARFDNGTARCAFELAYREGRTAFRKPVSCHLYPVRITRHGNYDAVNLHRWDVCVPAFGCGRRKGVRVFEFLREALIRKFGGEWFEQLAFAAKERQEKERPAAPPPGRP